MTGTLKKPPKTRRITPWGNTFLNKKLERKSNTLKKKISSRGGTRK